MRIASVSLALAVALSLGGIARAATVNALQGQVLVNTGQGYRLVDGSIQLEAGATVVANPGAVAQVVYGGGCAVTVQPGSVYQIAGGAPCGTDRSVPSGALADSGASSAAGSQSGGNGTLWVVGGAAVVAGGAGAYLIVQSLSP
ncbi:MAG TPA: hypothetical protein VGF29_15080 [Hyphomicrobiaceae bacterium]